MYSRYQPSIYIYEETRPQDGFLLQENFIFCLATLLADLATRDDEDV